MFDIVDGCQVGVERGEGLLDVGQDEAEGRALVTIRDEYDFEKVGGDGDAIGSDELGLGGRVEDWACDYDERVGLDGDSADEGFELGPAAQVEGWRLGSGVGEGKGEAAGFRGEGEVRGWRHVASGEGRVEVVGVGGARQGKAWVAMEAGAGVEGGRRGWLELCRG